MPRAWTATERSTAPARPAKRGSLLLGLELVPERRETGLTIGLRGLLVTELDREQPLQNADLVRRQADAGPASCMIAIIRSAWRAKRLVEDHRHLGARIRRNRIG